MTTIHNPDKSKWTPEQRAYYEATLRGEIPNIDPRTLIDQPKSTGNGGKMAVTDDDIRAFVGANYNNPNAVVSRANELGIGMDRLGSVFGGGNVNNYLGLSGISPSAVTGGVPTDNDIRQYVTANQGNPYAVIKRALETGVSRDRMNQLFGADNVNNYLSAAGFPSQQQTQIQRTQSPWGGNPYLDQMGDSLSRRMNKNLDRQFQSIRGNSIGVGGLGGGRQGVAEGLAMEAGNDSLTDAMSRMYMTDYEGTQNRNLQKYGIDTNAALGWGGLANQYDSIRNNFYLGNRSADNQDRLTGATLWGMGDDSEWSPIRNASNSWSPFTGFGNTTQSSSQGGGWQGLLGGALTGAATAKSLGWWS